eukprot:CAMPEP_0115265536 /NCGR_PEP_ID=MMETSP0270-20121206/51000_1 /TAXON_ID=71861 /ORGANISM="Scrippsiella trochoidea, Strain CCMP3099" /LENGTH=206 /DNA_ID=CAMNT_0002681599 /DNA_START=172 /DNA_END=789 /DNA_ORIENTATION=-
MTPKARPAPSPKLRDTAKPGFSRAGLSQTRAGPASSPSQPSIGMTVPARSLRVWQELAQHGAGVAHIAHVKHALAWVHDHNHAGAPAVLHLRPQGLVDVFVCLPEAASMARVGPAKGPPGCAARYAGSLSAATAETSWPFLPCPSKTQKNNEPSQFLPAQAALASWFTHPTEHSLVAEPTSTCFTPTFRSGSKASQGMHGINGSKG